MAELRRNHFRHGLLARIMHEALLWMRQRAAAVRLGRTMTLRRKTHEPHALPAYGRAKHGTPSAASRLRGLTGEPRAYPLDTLRLDGESTETDRPLAAKLHA